jgi:molybdopterin molybdotransferase
MPEAASMLSVEEGRARILQSLAPLPAQLLPIEQALYRVLATEVESREDLPPFDNSAMDGFALALHGHAAQAGDVFEVQGEQAAGQAPQGREAACEIMTGAALPAGLDSVVPVEQVEVLAHDGAGRPSSIRLQAAVPAGQHVRRAGEDLRRGAQVLAAGRRLGPQQLLVLAATGCAEVAVRPRPRVALFCTGRELRDAPGALEAGQIRNSNGPYLRAALAAAGAEVRAHATLPDEPEPLEAACRSALADGIELIISTGAVSMGRYDFVPETLARLGADTVFHKFRMRPGKPLLFARLPGGALYFGLPGNPASSAVGLRFFVEPALRALLGLAPELPLRLPLLEPARKKSGFALYQKARVELDAKGQAGVRLLPGQESFKVLPISRANAWALLPEQAETLAAGSLIDVYGLEHWGLQFSSENPT